ncbi:hypothetical protein FRX31_025643 [Thalictrum thalictroides]|uniref:Uncharacterized protein n=1 Tax=Thalictrum thalictroides TaxID=46969 RepID=A0A7J6VKX0_THATH|nr:hypothetical protein FRX31_025643 [Thalictrum thalictroides]
MAAKLIDLDESDNSPVSLDADAETPLLWSQDNPVEVRELPDYLKEALGDKSNPKWRGSFFVDGNPKFGPIFYSDSGTIPYITMGLVFWCKLPSYAESYAAMSIFTRYAHMCSKLSLERLLEVPKLNVDLLLSTKMKVLEAKNSKLTKKVKNLRKKASQLPTTMSASIQIDGAGEPTEL